MQSNRASVVEESAKEKITARDAARLERQRRLAEVLRTKVDAAERGEDVERSKNWDWTIEENEEWEKKKARKARRADFEFHGACCFSYFLSFIQCAQLNCTDDAHAARRRYKKDLDLIKPDLVAYNRRKEVAMGLAPGTLVRIGDSSINNFDPTAGASGQVIEPNFQAISI